MSRIRLEHGLVALAAALSAGCATDRDRPASDPLAPDASPARVYADIVHPRENQTYLRTTFSQPPGVQITFSGSYARGHALLVLAFSDVDPLTPFFAARTDVATDDFPRNAWILAEAPQLEGASEVEILLRVLDGRDRSIYTDSVGVRIQ